MEIVKSRYNNDRVIEKVSPTRLRIMGDSLIIRSSEDKDGNQTMFDFEGGPCLTVGGNIKFGKTKWKITKIITEKTNREGFCSVLLDVKL
jgi:hypothetical protein|tara:strand:- start:192 stop:461 length:270 start_codon:yes stop_codon:yes gene_type:complete